MEPNNAWVAAWGKEFNPFISVTSPAPPFANGLTATLREFPVGVICTCTDKLCDFLVFGNYLSLQFFV